MKKIRMRRWVKVAVTLVLIHLSFFIWRQTGTLGSLAQHDNGYLILTIMSWLYLTFGQAMIYKSLWER